MLVAAIRNLSPANFAFVMATGILSIIFYKLGWPSLSLLFLVIGLIGYGVLVALFIARLFTTNVFRDFKNVRKMFQYFTFCAGTNALAVSLCYAGYSQYGFYLGLVGVISTIFLMYALFVTFFSHVPVSVQSISPFWLLLAIACNSSGIVLTTLWEQQLLFDPNVLLLAFCFWIFGVFIYLSFMTLNLYRMIFLSFGGQDMDPCFWTCMGAAAIAVVDGIRLIHLPNLPQFLETIRPFMQGMVLFLWGWGTAWIPILCLMEIWKRVYFKIPFRYQPSRWAMVFPLGMYTEATRLLSSSAHLDVLQDMVPVWLWITFCAWCLVALMSRFNPFGGASS